MRNGARALAAKAHPKGSRTGTLACAVLCLVTALVAIGPYMLADGGAFHIREDFDFQQMPFTMALHNQIARGGLGGWCWGLDLGTSAIQGFGFYELGSPFFWVSMLFPAASFPRVVGWLYVAKYVVAGVTAYLWARRLLRDHACAIVCALLYAFSGFQTANLLFYHFHDVVAVFPLMLLGLDRLMAREDHGVSLCLAVAINALTSYFFVVQSSVFLVVYFALRYGPYLWREGAHALTRAVVCCLACGILGAGLAGALLVPSFLYMLQSPRAGSFSVSLQSLVFDPGKLGMELMGILLPADAMHDHNAVVSQMWSSTACWLPMTGPCLAMAYLRERRDWLWRMLVALLVVCLSPLLTSAFLLFTAVYQRWWYTLVLMGSLASARVLEDAGAFDVRRAARTNLALVAGFLAVLVLATLATGNPQVFHPVRLALYASLAVAGTLATRFLATSGARDCRDKRWVVCGICVFAAITTALTLHYYRQSPYTGEMLDHIETEERIDTLESIELGTKLEELDPQYRYNTGDNRLTLPGDAAGTSSFSSTICAATDRFETFFGGESGAVWHLNKRSVPGLTELVGGRYRVVCADEAREDDDVAARYQVGNTEYCVVAEPACPIGVTYDRYLAVEDALELDVDKRAIALLQAPVVDEADVPVVEGFASQVRVDELDLGASVEELATSASHGAVDDFSRNDAGFSFSVTCDHDALVYLSVPHDDGWSAFVDDKPADVVDSVGMMLLPVRAGTHAVEFRYQTPGVGAGLACSAISAVVLVGWYVLRHTLGTGPVPSSHR